MVVVNFKLKAGTSRNLQDLPPPPHGPFECPWRFQQSGGRGSNWRGFCYESRDLGCWQDAVLLACSPGSILSYCRSILQKPPESQLTFINCLKACAQSEFQVWKMLLIAQTAMMQLCFKPLPFWLKQHLYKCLQTVCLSTIYFACPTRCFFVLR